jgi:hypothetical protein
MLMDSVLSLVFDREAVDDGQMVYYRQYAGFLRKHHRYIYVNAFHASFVDDRKAVLPQAPPGLAVDTVWRTKAISVCDGGAGYFGVEYDPEKKQFGRVVFNTGFSGPITY